MICHGSPVRIELVEDTPGQVVFVPAGLNQHLETARLEAGDEIGFVPVPCLVAHNLAVGILSAAHRIIDDGTIGPKADDGASDACRVIGPAVLECPAARGLAIGGKFDAQRRPVFANHVADTAAPFLGELSGVRGGDDGLGWKARQIPATNRIDP